MCVEEHFKEYLMWLLISTVLRPVRVVSSRCTGSCSLLVVTLDFWAAIANVCPEHNTPCVLPEARETTLPEQAWHNGQLTFDLLISPELPDDPTAPVLQLLGGRRVTVDTAVLCYAELWKPGHASDATQPRKSMSQQTDGECVCLCVSWRVLSSSRLQNC